MSVDHPSTLVQLLFSGKNMKNMDYFSKSDPFVKVFIQTHSNLALHEVGRTETIDNCLDPVWKNTVPIRYYFEMKQQIKFQVYDEDSPTVSKFIGRASTVVGKIMGNKQQNITLSLTDDKGNVTGQLFVRAEKVVQSSHQVTMKWRAGKVANMDEGYINFWGKTDAYLKFLKIRSDGTTVLVGRTEHVVNDVHPEWKPITLSINRLVHKYQPESIFRVQCWDWEPNQVNHRMIGQVDIKIQNLKQPLIEFKLVDPKGKIDKPGNIILQSSEIVKVPNYVDYIRSGLQLNLSVAVDLSLSNKEYSDPTSLHHISNKPNQYQQVLRSIWQIIRNYDQDDKIYSYGFGAKPHFQKLNQNLVNHCFSLTGHEHGVHIKGLDDFMDSYIYALKNVQPSEPTYLCPVLQTSAILAKKQQTQNVYQILLILTDGQVDDINSTIQLLVKNCKLPMSVIIIGIGNGDFSKLAKYDADHGMTNSQGQPLERDFVQFVQYNKYKGNAEVLTSEILYEIPEQISKYMVLSGRSVVEKI